MDDQTKDKVIEAILSILESSLTHALDNLLKNYPGNNIAEILPIVLSRFAYQELFILSKLTRIENNKLNELFIALFKLQAV